MAALLLSFAGASLGGSLLGPLGIVADWSFRSRSARDRNDDRGLPVTALRGRDF